MIACFDFYFSHPRERDVAIVIFIRISLVIYSVKHLIGCSIYSSGRCPLRITVCFKNKLSELCFFVCVCMCTCACTHVCVGGEVKGQFQEQVLYSNMWVLGLNTINQTWKQASSLTEPSCRPFLFFLFSLPPSLLPISP